MSHDKTTFKDAIGNRRTIYQLEKKSPIPDSKIKEILELALRDVPSSFNSQSTRMVALFHDQHDKFWEIVKGKLKEIVQNQEGGDWEKTASRIKMFQDAYATILFYEDTTVVKSLQEKMAIYADKFPQWSEHTSAMHQYMLWTAFETEGLGCNLQHYNPLPDEEVQKVWGVPKEWEAKGQLVFGQPQAGARDELPPKDRAPIVEGKGPRLSVYGA